MVPEESVVIHWVAPLSTNFRKQCTLFPRRGIWYVVFWRHPLYPDMDVAVQSLPTTLILLGKLQSYQPTCLRPYPMNHQAMIPWFGSSFLCCWFGTGVVWVNYCFPATLKCIHIHLRDGCAYTSTRLPFNSLAKVRNPRLIAITSNDIIWLSFLVCSLFMSSSGGIPSVYNHSPSQHNKLFDTWFQTWDEPSK